MTPPLPVWARTVAALAAVLGLGLSLFHLYTAAFGTFGALLQRSVHLALAAALGFLGFWASGKRRKTGDAPGAPDVTLAGLSLVAFGVIAARYQCIEVRQALVDPLSTLDVLLGILGVLLILELARRIVGIVLALIAAVFVVYALVGSHLPGFLAHRGFSLTDIVDYQSFGLNGIFGIPLGVSASYVVLFIILGAILEESGAGEVIMDLGRKVAGPYRAICKAAAVPAILYYLGLLLMVDFEAARTGMRGLLGEELPAWGGILKRAHLVLPVGVLLYVLVRGYTPFWAAFVNVVAAVAVSSLTAATRLSPRALARLG